jgi:hypothetical protein
MLETLSAHFELVIYTAGTEDYLQNILEIFEKAF